MQTAQDTEVDAEELDEVDLAWQRQRGKAAPLAFGVAGIALSPLLLGLILGGMVGVGLAILRTFTDTRIKTTEDVDANTGVASLGLVYFDDEVDSSPMVALRGTPISESYRAIRTADALDLRMSMVGQRGMSSVVAHGIAEAMGPLTGYLCRVSPHAAEGVDTVSVKAKYGPRK